LKDSRGQTVTARNSAGARRVQPIVDVLAAAPGAESVTLISGIPVRAGGWGSVRCPEGSIEGDGRANNANGLIATPN
jgi:hypothetical protein